MYIQTHSNSTQELHKPNQDKSQAWGREYGDKVPLLAEELVTLMATERRRVTYGRAWVAIGRISMSQYFQSLLSMADLAEYFHTNAYTDLEVNPNH